MPPWVVPLYSLLGPILLFVAYRLVSGRPTHEVRRQEPASTHSSLGQQPSLGATP